MKRRLATPIIGLGIGIAVAIALYLTIKKPWNTSAGALAPVVGEIVMVSGHVEYRPSQALQFLTAQSKQILHSQELLTTFPGAEALLYLQGGASIRMNENSRFAAEIDATKPDTLIGTVIEGSVTVLSKGQAGSIRIYRQGREILIGDFHPRNPPTIKANADLIEYDQPMPTPLGLVVTATTHDDSAGEPAAGEDQSDSGATSGAGEGAGNVVTNSDIVRQLKGQTGFFQRCYLTYLHRAQNGKGGAAGSNEGKTGAIVLKFMIQATGRVTDAGVVRSEFDDQILHKCVAEVVGRTTFPSFEGAAIPVLEFPISLQ